MRAQHAPHRPRIVIRFVAAEVAALTTAAGAHDVARNLIEVPDLVGETNRAAPRSTVAVPPIGHADRDRRRKTAPESERRSCTAGVATDCQPLDSKSVFVGQV